MIMRRVIVNIVNFDRRISVFLAIRTSWKSHILHITNVTSMQALSSGCIIGLAGKTIITEENS